MPLPILVGEFNSDMVEQTNPDAGENVPERKRVLGMYMDALIHEGEFEGHLADFWYDEGHGRKKTRNMFYDPETDTVGVTDIGEHTGSEPDHMPDISLEERFS